MSDVSALGSVCARIKKHISRRGVLLFAMSYFIIVAVHLFAFTNKLINHDDLSELLGGGSLLASGRWLLNPVIKLTGRVSMPTVYGLAGSAFLALTVLTVVYVLRVRRTVTAAAVALCMAAHPTIVCTWAYMFTAPAYFFAMFLAVLGVMLIRRRGWIFFAAGAVLVGMSMGCYQAYLALAASLAVAALIVDICDGVHEGKWKPLLRACLRSLLGLLAGLAVYLVVLKICLWVTGTELLSYAGIDGMTDVSLAVLAKRFLTAAAHFAAFPLSPVFKSISGAFPALLYVGAGLSLLSVLALAIKRRLWRTPVTLVLLLTLVAVMPFALELVYIMADSSSVHWLMLYATVILWIFPAIAAERVDLPKKGELKRLIAAVAAVSLLAVTALTGYESTLITNKVYLEMELTRQSANNFLTRLITRVEDHEGYTQGAKVALIGSAYMNAGIPDEQLTGVFTGGDLLNIYSRGWLLLYYHGTSFGWVSPGEIEALKATEEFAGMPVYPAEGSIQTIDGIITVKLSA